MVKQAKLYLFYSIGSPSSKFQVDKNKMVSIKIQWSKYEKQQN